MRKLFLIFAILFSLGTSPVFAQTPEVPRSTNVIIQDIKSNYEKQREYIETLRAINNDKESTIDELRIKVDDITNKWTAAIEEDSKKTIEIINLTTKNKSLIKWLTIAVSILGSLLLLHIVIAFLKIKWNITLPYWLNSIL
jgi:ABC-type lipoprotein release transport system permease subunit